jgi:DNA mismatch endonuclease (patch repair protein)
MDVLTPEQRQRCMASISGKDTKPELIIRKLLYSLGYRYRLHYSSLPGKPDLVFPGKRKVIFIHGCFWHRHDCSKGKSMPKNNSEFWQKKLFDNENRDSGNIRDLKKLGWDVFVIWTCELKHLELLAVNLHTYLQTKTE